MELQLKSNYFKINIMEKNNISEMSYTDLVAKNNALQEEIKKKMEEAYALQEELKAKREEEMKRAFEELMNTFSPTQEEMKDIFDRVFSTPTTPTEEIALDNGKEPLALPEHEEKNETVEMSDIWNHPALQAPYNPLSIKESVTKPAPEQTTVAEADKELPTMEELLSDVPEYKKFFTPKTPGKKTRRLPAMDDLLSGKPVNQILCVGNLNPKGSPYLQHTRVCHPSGIIPTETATGHTLVYIPPTPPIAA